MRLFFFSSDSRKIFQRTNSKYLEKIKNTLIKMGYQKDEIDVTHETKCEEAIKKISLSIAYDLHIVCVNDDAEYSNGVAEYCALNTKNKNKLILILEKNFSHSSYGKSIILNPETNKIHLKYRQLEDEALLIKTLKTILTPPVVYVSYGNDEKEIARKIIEHLEKSKTLSIPYVELRYDSKSLKISSSVSTFINELCNGERVIIIINDKYLRSIYGMKELSQIIKLSKSGEKLKDRVFPLVMDSASYIRSTSKLKTIKEFWEKELHSLTDPTEKNDIKQIISVIDSLPKTIGDLYSLDIKLQANENFIDLMWSLHGRIAENGYIRPYNDDSELGLYLNNKKHDLYL